MNLEFSAGGRKRKLYQLKQGGSYYVRIQVRRKEIQRSTGTPHLSAAKERGKQIVEAVLYGDWDKSNALKMRSDAPTLREVCDRFLEKYGRSRTGRGYVGGLKKLVRVALGISDAVKDPLANVKTTVLTAKLIRDFEAAEEQRIPRERGGALDRAAEMRVRTSITSRVRQARSIFSPKCMHWYDGMNLPNLDGFRAQGVRPPRRRGDPRPLDEAAIAGMFEDSTRLAVEDPACYVAFILFSLMGMRNSEIKKARRSWLRRDANGGAILDIIDRPEENFFCKGYERHLPVDPEIVKLLDEHYKHSPDGDFLVPAAHKTERDNIVDDRHNDWARPWIKDYTKISYELRRYAGSLILKKTGRMKAVQKYLGHSSIATTEKWYAYLLGELPTLSFSDFANGHALTQN
jgi:integrase